MGGEVVRVVRWHLFADSGNMVIEMDQKEKQQKKYKKTKRIKIGNIVYESVREAAVSFGVSHPLIRHQYNRFGTFRGLKVEYLD